MVLVTLAEGLKPWLAASDDDTLPTLTSVCLQLRTRDAELPLRAEGVAVATDTHILAVVPCSLEFSTEQERDAFPEAGVMVPALLLLKNAPKRGDVCFWLDVDAGEVKVPTKNGTVTAPLLFGTFPNWERLIKSALCHDPSTTRAGFLAFNPELALTVSRALGLEARSGTPFLPTDEGKYPGPWLLLNPKEPRAVGLLMPTALPDTVWSALTALQHHFGSADVPPARLTNGAKAKKAKKEPVLEERTSVPVQAAPVPAPEPEPLPEPLPEPAPAVEVPARCPCGARARAHTANCPVGIAATGSLPVAAVRPGWIYTGN